MNYARYNPSTGDIINMGWGEDFEVQKEIDDGKPTLPVEPNVEWGKWKVNLTTKELEPITDTQGTNP